MTLALSKRKGLKGMELPKNEAELQALLDANAKEITDTLTAKHNSDMATMRKKYDSDLAKERERANMSAEQLAEQKVKEQQEAQEKELNELRSFKKQSVISEKLSKANLPQYFKNDNRLLNADESDYDKVIKEITKDYEGSQPKGATTSTVMQTNTGCFEAKDDKARAYAEFGKALEQAIEK